MIAICLGMAIQHLAVFLGSKAGAVLSGRSGLPFVWVLRKAWGWKPVSCRAISDEFAVGPRLLFELRFKFWTVFLSGHPLKGQCVFQVFGEHFHSDQLSSKRGWNGMVPYHDLDPNLPRGDDPPRMADPPPPWPSLVLPRA